MPLRATRKPTARVTNIGGDPHQNVKHTRPRRGDAGAPGRSRRKSLHRRGARPEIAARLGCWPARALRRRRLRTDPLNLAGHARWRESVISASVVVSSQRPKTIVVGAGVIGLRARRRGRAVPWPARGAGAGLGDHGLAPEITGSAGRAPGIVSERGRDPADIVVLAAGAWSREIGGIPPAYLPPVRPIKGQMLALQMDPAAPLLRHVLWLPPRYLVPPRDRRLLIGPPVQEHRFGTT